MVQSPLLTDRLLNRLGEITFLVLASYSTLKTGNFDASAFGLGYGVYLAGKGAGFGLQSFGLPFAPAPSNPAITPPEGG